MIQLGKKVLSQARRNGVLVRYTTSCFMILLAGSFGSMSYVNSSTIGSTVGILAAPERVLDWQDRVPIVHSMFLIEDTNTSDEDWSPFRKGQTCIVSDAENERNDFVEMSANEEQSWDYRIGLVSNSMFLFATTKVAPFYWNLLETDPIMTKSITSFVIGGIGDLYAQFFELRFAYGRGFDLRRTLSVAAEGLLISGPLMHFVYDWMETILPIEGSEASVTWIHAMIHVLIDSVLLDCLFVATLMVFTGVLEGKVGVIAKELQYDFIPTLKASWMSNFFFSPLEFLLFKFVPAKLRVLAINIQDIIWNAVVSYMAHRSRKEHL